MKNLIAIAVICLILVAGCASGRQENPSPTGQSAEQDDFACVKSNCWVGIIPGTTTMAQAQTLLVTRYGRNNVGSGRGSLNWNYAIGSGKFQSGTILADSQGLVSDIEVSLPKEQLTVAEFISRFGEPSFVYVTRAFSSQVACAGSQISYSTIGLQALLYPINRTVGIEPQQSITSLTLLPPTRAKDLIMTDTAKLAWQGYRDYCKF